MAQKPRKTVTVGIAVTPAQKRAIQSAARRDKRTVAAWLRLVSLRAAEASETPGAKSEDAA